MMNIALETIYDIENSDVAIDALADFDSATYFDNVLGVTKNIEAVKTIRLRVAAESVNYLKTKPLHESQRAVNDDGTEITLQLIPNYELQQAILQYGPQIEVLEPHSLRKEIGERLRKAAEIYSN